MVEAYVQRGLGDLPGPDIIDPLMSELQVLVLRGATAIDRASNLQKLYLDLVYRPFVQRGQLVEVQDVLQGENWRGKIVAVAYTARGGTVLLAITVVRAGP